jgi:hypothetical protein
MWKRMTEDNSCSTSDAVQVEATVPNGFAGRPELRQFASSSLETGLYT